MSFKVSTSKERVTPAKKNISISNVSIVDGFFCDEEGNIAERLISELPEGINVIDLKISLELASDEEVDED